MKKYIVKLSDEERNILSDLVKKGRPTAFQTRRANILLQADQSPGGPAWTDQQIADAYHCRSETVSVVRKTFICEGFDAVMTRRNENVGRPRKIDAETEAKLTELARSEPPPGHSHWTVRLLADKLVELKILDSCGKNTVQRALKKALDCSIKVKP